MHHSNIWLYKQMPSEVCTDTQQVDRQAHKKGQTDKQTWGQIRQTDRQTDRQAGMQACRGVVCTSATAGPCHLLQLHRLISHSLHTVLHFFQAANSPICLLVVLGAIHDPMALAASLGICAVTAAAMSLHCWNVSASSPCRHIEVAN